MLHVVFNLREAAGYLHLTQEDLELLMRRREVPFSIAGTRAVFKKDELEAWASRRILGLEERQLRNYHRDSHRGTVASSGLQPLVSDLLAANGITAALKAKTRASVLREMVRLADRTGLLIYPEDLLASLEEREALCSTALPGGVALLHPRQHDEYMFEASFLALARTPQPVPFNAPDGKRTDLFFLLCCRDDRLHLHLLSRLCMMGTQTTLIEQLRQASDACMMAAVLRETESAVILAMR